MSTISIPVAAITVHENPRKQFDQASTEALAATIKKHGLLQPIVVQEDGQGQYRLVAGERRLRAVKHLGLDSIEASVRAFGEDVLPAVQLIENLAREDLSPLEEAHAIQAAYDASFGGRTASNDELQAWATTIGMGSRKVRYAMNLANASDYVQAFGKPFSIYQKKQDETGNVVLDETGKPVMQRHERQPLDAIALRTLVKLNRQLRKFDQACKKENGSHRPIAEKTIVRLGQRASMEGWSAKKLDVEAKAVMARLEEAKGEPPTQVTKAPLIATETKVPPLSLAKVAALSDGEKAELGRSIEDFLRRAGFANVKIVP